MFVTPTNSCPTFIYRLLSYTQKYSYKKNYDITYLSNNVGEGRVPEKGSGQAQMVLGIVSLVFSCLFMVYGCPLRAWTDVLTQTARTSCEYRCVRLEVRCLHYRDWNPGRLMFAASSNLGFTV